MGLKIRRRARLRRSASEISSGSGTKRIANPSRWAERSWTVRRWPVRRGARRSRRSTMSATTSGGSPRRRPDVSRLRAVLFDVDGTLLDTLDAWVRAFDAGLAAIRRPSMSGFDAARWIGTPTECVAVGDTENDVRAAKEAGARSIGVTWGYGTRTNLEAAGVDHLIETPEALPPLLRALAAGRPL